MAFEIVVTEVTLYGTLRCVAGYDRAGRRMIRPEPEPGAFWPALVCGENTTFHPGHVVRFRGSKPETAMPHRTEDIVVDGKPHRASVLNTEDFRAVLRESAHLTPGKVYGDHLVFDGQRAFVRPGAPCGSLACLTVRAATLTFLDDAYDDRHKLRAGVEIDGRRLQLPVAAKTLKQAFQKGGVQAARDLTPTTGAVQVRLGLARPFADIPDKCYLQINGIHAV